MSKKIKLNKVAPTKRYRIRELAEALGISRRAIYYKVKDGLPVFIMRGTFYVVGEEFIEYEKSKREKRKKGQLRPEEFFCINCNEKRRPLNLEVQIKKQIKNPENVSMGTVILEGICPVCKQKMFRIYNRSQESQYSTIFNIF